MRKLVLSLVTMLSLGANAQSFNVKGGLNVSTLSNTKARARVGVNLGVSYEAPITDKFSIQPELLLNMKGYGAYEVEQQYLEDQYRIDYQYGGLRTEQVWVTRKATETGHSMFYLSLPVVAKYEFVKNFKGEAGLEPSLLLGKSDASEKSFDLGLVFGAGYNINEKFSVGVRYTLGLIGVYDLGMFGRMADIKNPKNRNFSIGVSYKLK